MKKIPSTRCAVRIHISVFLNLILFVEGVIVFSDPFLFFLQALGFLLFFDAKSFNCLHLPRRSGGHFPLSLDLFSLCSFPPLSQYCFPPLLFGCFAFPYPVVVRFLIYPHHLLTPPYFKDS